jgi:hypothetical protein
MLSHGTDMRYDNHKNVMLSQLAFLENVSHYSLIRIFTIFLWSFFGQINKCFTQFQAGDRLEALFGVSILEDKGQARNELWDIVYQMSCVICKFSTFTFEYILLKKISKKSYISYWISDSETCQRRIDLRYEILLFISYNYNVHRSYLLILSCGFWSVVTAKIWICAREIYIELFLFHINAVKY